MNPSSTENPKETHKEKQSKLCTLVLSGGEGYVNFRIGECGIGRVEQWEQDLRCLLHEQSSYLMNPLPVGLLPLTFCCQSLFLLFCFPSPGDDTDERYGDLLFPNPRLRRAERSHLIVWQVQA